MRHVLVGVLAGAWSLASAAVGAAQGIAVVPAPAPLGFHRMEASRATLGTNPIQVWRVLELRMDCSEAPGLVMRIAQPPQHGSASVKEMQEFPAFPTVSPYSKCNTEKVPQHAAVYQANPGFTGEDRLVLQVQTPEGRVNEVTVDVDVR